MKILILIGGLVAVMFASLLFLHGLQRSRKGQHHVIYRVEGKRNAPRGDSSAWISVVLEGVNHETVALPYNLNFYAPAGTPLALSAQYLDNSPNGQLEVMILVDDQIVASGKSSGNELATATGTIK